MPLMFGDGGISGLRVAPDGKVIRRTFTSRERRESAARSRKSIPPETLPDWGLEPAASSWIRVRLPLQPHEDPPLPLHPREERESKKPRMNMDTESPKVATIMIWDLPHNVNCDNLRTLCQGVDGILGVFYSSFRHLMLVDFVTRQAAYKGRAKIACLRLMNRPLKIAFFWNKYVLNRDAPSRGEKSGILSRTVCVEGFDSSLYVPQIRILLARHFGSNNEGIMIPTNSDGSSIGRAYIKYRSCFYVSEALILNGSYLGKHKLHVSISEECNGANSSWDGHITLNGPGTGKRIVFNYDSDE